MHKGNKLSQLTHNAIWPQNKESLYLKARLTDRIPIYFFFVKTYMQNSSTFKRLRIIQTFGPTWGSIPRLDLITTIVYVTTAPLKHSIYNKLVPINRIYYKLYLQYQK